MKNTFFEQVTMRRRVRQAKRRSAVDQTRSYRRRVASVLFVIAVLFILLESIGLSFAKNQHDQDRATDISADIVSDLAIISSALQSGNQALYDKSYNQFTHDLAAYLANNYVQYHQADRAAKLKEYYSLLHDNAETIRQLNYLHSMLLQLGNVSRDGELAARLSDYRQNLQKLESSLDAVDATELSSAKQELKELSANLKEQLDGIIVCTNICPDHAIDDKRQNFIKSVEAVRQKIDQLNTELNARYSPAPYILLLQ
ncbi:hypothetical protein IJ102_01065 [Candidatus Saccharibacteria bacterium]|nr:hypothetical protein [Candidatus Saccharibacteria bacterium]